MKWVISSINNATHKVTLTREDGARIETTIPLFHRYSREAKLNWLKAQGPSYDRGEKAKKKGINYVLLVVLASVIIGVILKIL